mmetsp:Transcript_392/g.903  ORF Transcript_392/g.903 Transcript_392/m.903 type:complete len:340 (+) Transcript_392:498-1517(+)
MIVQDAECDGCGQRLLSSMGCICHKQEWKPLPSKDSSRDEDSASPIAMQTSPGGAGALAKTKGADQGKTGSDLVFLDRLWSSKRRIGVTGIRSNNLKDNKASESIDESKVGISDIEVFEFKQERSKLASTVWPSSIVMAQIVVPLSRQMEQEKGRKLHCLELGCGLGLVSKVLSALGHSVVATDKEDVSFAGSIGDVQIAHFDWCRTDQAPEPVRESFDLIVGADLIYQKGSRIPLAMALDYCLARSPGAQVLLAFQVRSPSEEEEFISQVCPSYGLITSPWPLPVAVTQDAAVKDLQLQGVEFLNVQHLQYVRCLQISRGVASTPLRQTSSPVQGMVL